MLTTPKDHGERRSMEGWRGTQCIQYKVIEFKVDDRRTKKSMSAENTKGAISTLRSLPLKYGIIVSNDLE